MTDRLRQILWILRTTSSGSLLLLVVGGCQGVVLNPEPVSGELPIDGHLPVDDPLPLPVDTQPQYPQCLSPETGALDCALSNCCTFHPECRTTRACWCGEGQPEFTEAARKRCADAAEHDEPILSEQLNSRHGPHLIQGDGRPANGFSYEAGDYLVRIVGGSWNFRARSDNALPWLGVVSVNHLTCGEETTVDVGSTERFRTAQQAAADGLGEELMVRLDGVEGDAMNLFVYLPDKIGDWFDNTGVIHVNVWACDR